jgi:hypothetical protein
VALPGTASFVCTAIRAGMIVWWHSQSRSATGRAKASGLEHTAFSRHNYGVKAIVQLDPSNRIILSKDLRRAAGFTPRQKLKVSAGPGRIVLEAEANSRGKIVRRGKLKVWTGAVPALPLAEAVEQSRRYER